ncbi:MAG TPA: DUF5615 family PIN-like protein [Candidatus Kapabacteria bacterium]|nr:DUF5615 family PIN-like protein [Candidatus Kapabacteria bacterium]
MIIADENLDSRIISDIRAIPIPVYSIAEEQPGISDEDIAKIAATSGKIILTRDKDFADLVFAEGMKDISVILLRYRNENRELMLSHLLTWLSKDPSELYGKFITISEHRVRTHTI